MKKLTLFTFVSVFFALFSSCAFANVSIGFKDVYHTTGMSSPVAATITIIKNGATVVDKKKFNLNDSYILENAAINDTIILKDTATTNDAAQNKDTKCYQLENLSNSCEIDYYSLEYLCYEDASCPLAGIHQSTCAYKLINC